MSRGEGRGKGWCDRRCECDGWTWSKERAQANRSRVHSVGRIAGVAIFIIDLYELNRRELFNRGSQWLHNTI